MAQSQVTVFGGSGFLGRRIVGRLAAGGAAVRVAVRNAESVPEGGAGQVVAVHADVRDEDSVMRAVEGSGAVVNAVGLYVERGEATFDAVHVRGARHVARQSARAGIERLVHISGIGADADSESPYVRARAAGEAAVKDAFPGATILRPSVMFGPEDAFFNTLAALARLAPALPLFGGGLTRLQPVYVGDVAEAAAQVLARPEARGRTYELGGPRVYTYKALMQLLLEEIGRKRILVPVPYVVGEVLAVFAGILPSPPLTRDQITLMKTDNVVGGQVLALADLGIEPTAVETVLPTYMNRFRRRGRRASV